MIVDATKEAIRQSGGISARDTFVNIRHLHKGTKPGYHSGSMVHLLASPNVQTIQHGEQGGAGCIYNTVTHRA